MRLQIAGHTTMSCPHRVAMEHGVIPAPARNTKTPLDYIFMRQLKAKIPKVRKLEDEDFLFAKNELQYICLGSCLL